MKNFILFFTKLLFIFIWACFILGIIFYTPTYPFGEKEIVIEPGIGVREIATILTKESIISHPYLFIIPIKFYGDEKKIKAGRYILRTNMSLNEVLKIIIKGRDVLERVTIPEGLTSKQIADILYNKGIISDKKSFLSIVKKENLEGYLFPDTYYVPQNYGEENIIKMMVKRFEEKLPKDFNEKLKEIGLNEREVIILASLVEKEAKYSEDRPKIASVFINRIKKGMKLESCATIQYILGIPKPNLSYEDLKIESPYNTYLHKGLPPGPICNPGEASILAVLNPAKTDYLYFVVDKDGKHLFAKTYKEHLKNKKNVKR